MNNELLWESAVIGGLSAVLAYLDGGGSTTHLLKIGGLSAVSAYGTNYMLSDNSMRIYDKKTLGDLMENPFYNASVNGLVYTGLTSVVGIDNRSMLKKFGYSALSNFASISVMKNYDKYTANDEEKKK